MRTPRAPLFFVSLLVVSGCVPVVPPGEEVGTFAVAGALAANNCGSDAVPVFSQLDFSVVVRREESLAYWDRSDSDSPMVQGLVEDEENSLYTFVAQSQLRARHPDAPPQIPDCVLTQTEEIRFDLVELVSDDEDMNDPPKETPQDLPEDPAPGDELLDEADEDRVYTLVGTQTIDWTPSSLQSCGYLLWTEGGPFDALPCGVSYTLTGDNAPTDE